MIKYNILTLNKKDITDFAKERNILLNTSNTDWNLFLDLDEKLSNELRSEIRNLDTNNYSGFYIRRHEFFMNKRIKYGEFSGFGAFGNTRLLRLGRKSKGIWKRAVHEYWDINGRLGQLKNPILHYPHPTLKLFLNNINCFSTLHAKALNEEGKKSSLIKIIVWPVGKFVYNYFFRFGFLDGGHGLVAAIFMSFHSFLSWSKLYLKQY